MNTRTLTSANAILLIGVTGLYDTPQRIQGFSADDITDTDQVGNAQVSMGLDGRLSAGFVPMAIAQNITLQADSLSVDFFENWMATERRVREKFMCFGTLVVPSISKEYAMVRGVLTNGPLTPALGTTVKPRRYTITWENIQPAMMI